MKKYLPIVAVIIFILALLGFSNHVMEQQKLQEAQAAYEEERHLLVYSDMPDDVNAGLAQAFYKRTGMRVQIQSKTDDQIGDLLGSAAERQPDVILASEPMLRRLQKQEILKPFASEQTETVPYAFKSADGYWTGLWLDPIVFVISKEYYAQKGLHIQNWDDLLTDPMLRLAFPDLASMDMAGDFLCSFVEMKGVDAAGLYLRALQSHVAAYSKSMSVSVRRVASGEADIGVVDAAMARQYKHDGAPLYILYPQDGTSYWLTGAAVTQWCAEDELAASFMNWLFSADVDAILRRNHIFLTYASETAPQEADAKGQKLVLFPVKKQYTDAGRKELQDWWIKTIRFGKEQ